MLFDFHRHLNNLIKSMVQQEIQVIQWRRVLVLKSIKKSFLYHPKLNGSTFKYLPEFSALFSNCKMFINNFKQLGSWNWLIEDHDVVNRLASEVFRNPLDKFLYDEPVLVILCA